MLKNSDFTNNLFKLYFTNIYFSQIIQYVIKFILKFEKK